MGLNFEVFWFQYVGTISASKTDGWKQMDKSFDIVAIAENMKAKYRQFYILKSNVEGKAKEETFLIDKRSPEDYELEIKRLRSYIQFMERQFIHIRSCTF